MAWTCSGASNNALVANLVRTGYAVGKRVEDAMRAVDRQWFVTQGDPYQDSPQYLGDGATISAPHMHAHALSILETNLKPDATVLDVGSGSGYLTACLAQMIGPKGLVVGVEHVDRLIQLAERDIQKARKAGVEMAEIKFVVADGRNGYAECAPYDCIHVGAAVKGHPQALIDQLKEGGLLYVPEEVGHGQAIILYRKQSGQIERHQLFGVRYVPLTSLKDQLSTA